jgi:hypothetical protein
VTSAARTSECGFAIGYEPLRSGVLGRGAVDGRFGLVVLLREGVAAWMAHACTPTAPSPPISPPPANDRPPVAPLFSDELRNDMALVLASMVMTTREERCA